MTDSTETFERRLRGDEGSARLEPDRMAAIRRAGARRRRGRRATAGVAVGAAACLAIGALALGPAGPGADRARDGQLPPASAPREQQPPLWRALQERSLAEIPGATRVSPGQVVLPAPRAAQVLFEQRVDPVGPVVPTGQAIYHGVTGYPRDAFPGWLWTRVERIEQEDLGDLETGYPVGSTEMGLLVEAGEAVLGCVDPVEDTPRGRCEPAVLLDEGGRLTLAYGFGTETFLDPGTDMEVFAPRTLPGDAAELTVAGLPDDSVTRVELVNTAGERVDGGVTHDLVDGASILWGAVPGQVARVVAYDAAGEVVEDHALRACSGGADCEVR